MALAITAAPADELLSAEEAKRHLRVYSSDLDDEITRLIQAARDYCERYTQRTLRNTVTRTKKFATWFSEDYRLPWPPLIAVSSITYRDVDNVSQTLDAANYYVETGHDGAGRIVWRPTASLPALFDCEDAVTVTFTTGYTSVTPGTQPTLNPLPPVVLQAMKMKLTELWGAGTEGEIAAAAKCADRLLSMADWTGYA